MRVEELVSSPGSLQCHGTCPDRRRRRCRYRTNSSARARHACPARTAPARESDAVFAGQPARAASRISTLSPACSAASARSESAAGRLRRPPAPGHLGHGGEQRHAALGDAQLAADLAPRSRPSRRPSPPAPAPRPAPRPGVRCLRRGEPVGMAFGEIAQDRGAGEEGIERDGHVPPHTALRARDVIPAPVEIDATRARMLRSCHWIFSNVPLFCRVLTFRFHHAPRVCRPCPHPRHGLRFCR